MSDDRKARLLAAKRRFEEMRARWDAERPAREAARQELRDSIEAVRQSGEDLRVEAARRAGYSQGYRDGFCDGRQSRRWGFKVYRGK